MTSGVELLQPEFLEGRDVPFAKVNCSDGTEFGSSGPDLNSIVKKDGGFLKVESWCRDVSFWSNV